MLREIQGLRQDRPNVKRCWYHDDFFDFYTWHSVAGMLLTFQLYYDIRGRERALTWHYQRGFAHNGVETKTSLGSYPATPLLAGAPRFPHRLVRQRFLSGSLALPTTLRNFVLYKMREYARSEARGRISLPHISRRCPNQDPAISWI